MSEQAPQNAPNAPAKRSIGSIFGWVLTVLLTLFMLFSCYGKFFDFPDKDKMFEHIGWSQQIMVYIGVLEIVIALLFLVPRTAFLAAILITAYLGGAIATHVRSATTLSSPSSLACSTGLHWVCETREFSRWRRG